LSEFMKSLHSIQKYRPDLALNYVLPTFMDTRVNHPQHIYAQLRELYGGQICPPIRYDEAFCDAPSYGKTIFEYAPTSRGADDYRELVRRVSDTKAVA
jgi:chromosome partitioning protein